MGQSRLTGSKFTLGRQSACLTHRRSEVQFLYCPLRKFLKLLSDWYRGFARYFLPIHLDRFVRLQFYEPYNFIRA